MLIGERKAENSKRNTLEEMIQGKEKQEYMKTIAMI
jgi:hypothetical protein